MSLRRRPARPVWWKSRPFRADERGNLQVVEALIVVSLVTAAVVSVSTLNVPVTRTETFKADTEQLLKDSLDAMYLRSSTYEGDTFGSALEQYVMESLAGDSKNLTTYLNRTLPGGAAYNVALDNGYGPPRYLVYNGNPPRESVAATYPFVPRLAYLFMQPQFSYYHGDFPMKVYSIPVKHGILAQDEGDAIELQLKYVDKGLGNKGFTYSTYGHTALRRNIDDAREWPSVSIYLDESGRTYHKNISSVTPINVQGYQYSLYETSFSMALEETADVKVPKNTEVRVEFPRGWRFNATQQAKMQDGTLDNDKWWGSFTFTGSEYVGTVITARLTTPFQGSKIWFNITGSYSMLLDTAFPYFTPFHVSLGNGAQGIGQVSVRIPNDMNTAGIKSRDAYLSIPKPIISGDTARWGFSFTNTADRVDIQRVTIRQPDGNALFADIDHVSGTAAGTWAQDVNDDAKWHWTPAAGIVAVTTGDAFQLAFEVTSATTDDNSYRSGDHTHSVFRFDPTSTQDTNLLGTWWFNKTAFNMNPAWSFQGVVPPYDDAPAYGWPDQSGNSYSFRGTTEYGDLTLAGRTNYRVLPNGATGNVFGDYQGNHAFSSLTVADQDRDTRTHSIGGKAYIRNNFTALFERLSTIDALANTAVGADILIRTDIYTPERAWKGLYTERFESQLQGLLPGLSDIAKMVSADLNQDGYLDVVVADTANLVVALDGRDGAKFWTYQSGQSILLMVAGDVDDNGGPEVLLGTADGVITGLDGTARGQTNAERELWTITPDVGLPSGAESLLSGLGLPTSAGHASNIVKPRDIIIVRPTSSADPNLVVAYSSDLVTAYVRTFASTGRASVETASTYQITDLDNDPENGDLRIMDMDAVTGADGGHYVAFVSENHTVTLADRTDLSIQWTSKLPAKPLAVRSGDVDADGWDDLVVDLDGGEAVVVDGETGRWGFRMRPGPGSYGIPFYWPVDGLVLQNGQAFIVDLGPLLIQNDNGFNEVKASASTVAPTDGEDIAGLQGLNSVDLLSEWSALHTNDGITPYMLGRNGEIRKVQTSVAYGTGALDWTVVKPKDVDYQDALLWDFWVDPDYETAGKAYAIDDHGKVYLSTAKGTFALMTDICTAVGPCAGGSLETFPSKWEAVTDGQGKATAFYTIVHRNTTSGSGPEESVLYKLDATTFSWETLRTWPALRFGAIDRLADGTLFVAGDGGRIESAPGPDGPWTAHAVHGARSFYVDDIEMVNATEGYVVGTRGAVYRMVGPYEWQPVLYHDEAGRDEVSLVLPDGTGKVWLWGAEYRHAPLATYATSAEAVWRIEDALGSTPQRLEITAKEYTFGGSNTEKTLTPVEWYYRFPSVASTWLSLGSSPEAELPGPHDRSYYDLPACPSAADCATVEVKAVLSDRIVSQSATGLVEDPSVTPVIRDVVVRLRAGTGALSTILRETTVDISDLEAGSTAVYSSFARGAVLPARTDHWGLRENLTSSARHVAIGDAWDGTAGAEILLSSDVETRVWNGVTGRTVRSVTWPSGTPESWRLFDATGDGERDLVIGTDEGNIMVLDVGSGAITTRAGTSGETEVFGVVDLTSVRGGTRFAWAGDEDVLYGIDVDGGSTLWAVTPSTTEARITFEYEIPDDALYGTYFVVSELRSQVSETGVGTVTQAARMVDWFNVTPPDKKMPRPPVYEIQIVSWFNEQ